ncbi:MAG: HNH endonuclease [Hyphomicrobiales bacterium]|nr:HNH endonuclease [Hyphomicrobiales bacterium]
MAERRNWSENEVRYAFVLYLNTAFGRLHKGNPDVINLAKSLKRTPSAVALKLVNLAALDTSIPQKGMGNTSQADRIVWAEFMAVPDRIIEIFAQQSCHIKPSSSLPLETKLSLGVAEEGAKFDFEGSKKQVVVTRRIGQDLFRKMILVSYQNRCALTGIEDSRLLNASHIVPWKDDAEIRVNPTNGICLNALHDRAFDRHLITFDEEYKMNTASHVPAIAGSELEKVDTGRLELPKRFLPAQEFLERHRRKFFEKNM